MHADQIDIEPGVAEALISEQFGQFKGQPIVPLDTAGTVNRIFRIGSFHAARFPMQAGDLVALVNQVQAEARASVEFAEVSPVPGPRPLGIGRPTPAYPLPWSVQTWIAGDIATPDGVSDSAAFAGDLVRLISGLRASPLAGRVFAGPGRGGHLPDHDDWMDTCLERSAGLLDVARLRGMWAQFRTVARPEREVMSHKDLIPGNLVVRDKRLVGVLDTGGFGPADPALDLVAGWHLLDRERRAQLRHGLGVSDLEWRRGAAWAFEQAMGLVWYYEKSNPAMSALGRSTLARLMDDGDW